MDFKNGNLDFLSNVRRKSKKSIEKRERERERHKGRRDRGEGPFG
jgi:hypothetical protein